MPIKKRPITPQERAIINRGKKKTEEIPGTPYPQDRAGFVSPHLQMLRALPADKKTPEQWDQQGRLEQARSARTNQYDISIPQTMQANGRLIPAARTNNPFNIEDRGQRGTVPSDERFAVFNDPQMAVAAFEKQVRLDKIRGMSLEEYAYKYAPPGENDTEVYLQRLERATGVRRNQPLSYARNSDLATVQARFESGSRVTLREASGDTAVRREIPREY